MTEIDVASENTVYLQLKLGNTMTFNEAATYICGCRPFVSVV